MIVIVDYDMGNVGSIKNMLKKLGVPSIVSGDLNEIETATKLILPGVGAFDTGMDNLHRRGILPVINRKVLDQGTPILGICLGMQLMMTQSEEGSLPGLGWIDGDVRRFRFDTTLTHLKVPHMGWNKVQFIRESLLSREMYPEPRFYFVHSYYVVCHQTEDTLGYTTHGTEFVSAFQRANIAGVQFHPEKSHKFGMKLLGNFAEAF